MLIFDEYTVISDNPEMSVIPADGQIPDFPVSIMTRCAGDSEADYAEMPSAVIIGRRRAALRRIAYKNELINLIRKRYDLNDELAIHRRKESEPDKWREYDLYVESCRRQAAAIAGIEINETDYDGEE